MLAQVHIPPYWRIDNTSLAMHIQFDVGSHALCSLLHHHRWLFLCIQMHMQDGGGKEGGTCLTFSSLFRQTNDSTQRLSYSRAFALTTHKHRPSCLIVNVCVYVGVWGVVGSVQDLSSGTSRSRQLLLTIALLALYEFVYFTSLHFTSLLSDCNAEMDMYVRVAWR
jgi:hypothetical protein